MNKLIPCAIAAISMFSLPAGCNAATAAEQYELSVLCGKRAEDDWAKRGQDKPGLYGPGSWVRYENHFSTKFQRCYVMHVLTQPHKDGDTWMLYTLFDVDEHREIASYLGVDGGETGMCGQLKNRCTSKAQWDRLIRPYWEE
jgi:hypothetical protein